MKLPSYTDICRPYSISEELRIWAERFCHQPALTDATHSLTYAELHQRAEAIAAGLYLRGMRPGMRAIVQFPNSIALVLSIFACLRLGVIPLLTLPAYREAEVDFLCSTTSPTAYFAPRQFAGHCYAPLMNSMRQRHPSLMLLVTDEPSAPGYTALDDLTGVLSDMPFPAADSTAMVIMTGGTTSMPKLVPKIHNQYLAAATASTRRCGITRNSVYMATLPVGHHFCMGCPGILGAFAVGAKVVLASSPSFDEVFSLVQQEKVTHMPAVPPLLRAWAESRSWDDSDISSLRLIQVGGGPVDSDTLRLAFRALQCPIQQGYGFSEGFVCYTDYDDVSAPTDGQLQGAPLFAEDELRIVDENGNSLPPGQEGELVFRGPCMISSYFMRENEQDRPWLTTDGFYRSGDRASWTESGKLRITGRLTEVINRAGEKFSMRELEDHIRRHPAIRDAAVVAVPDHLLGERQCVWIIPEDDCPPPLPQLHAYLRQQGVAPFKLPDQLEILGHWPVTAVGKIDKRKLTFMAQEKGR